MIFSKETQEVLKKREEEWLTEIKEAGADEITPDDILKSVAESAAH